MLMRLRIHVILLAACVPSLPSAVYGAELYDVGQPRPHFESFFINEPHACVNCELSSEVVPSAITRGNELGKVGHNHLMDVAAIELDLSADIRESVTERSNAGAAFRCPETAPVAGALTGPGLINMLFSLGMVTVEKARVACDALARGSRSGANAQDGARFRFSRPLSQGMDGPDVRELQRFLNTQGFVLSEQGGGSPGNETNFFGTLTVEAVKRYQKTYAAEILDPKGLSAPSGIFGPSSIRKANKLLEERRQ